MVIHSSFMYIGVWIHGNGDPTDDPDGVLLKHKLVPWGCASTGECSEGETYELRVNLYGIVCLLLVLVMTAFAHPWVRRHKFEWFYYTHHLFLPLLIFVCLHYPGALVYLIPGISIYSVDKLMGLFAYKSGVKADMCMVSSDVLKVSVKLGKGVRYHAGQCVFLNVPEISYQYGFLTNAAIRTVNVSNTAGGIRQVSILSKDAANGRPRYYPGISSPTQKVLTLLKRSCDNNN
jgi:hypothetical protein